MKKHTDSTISKLNDKIRNLNANFKEFELDVQVCKKVNDVLVKQGASCSGVEKRIVRYEACLSEL